MNKESAPNARISPETTMIHLERPRRTISARKGQNLNHPKIEAKLAQIPQSYRSTYRQVMRGRSLRKAVNAQCLECVGWQRKEVALCTAISCPMYPYRPYQQEKR